MPLSAFWGSEGGKATLQPAVDLAFASARPPFEVHLSQARVYFVYESS
jgi:hypothetical protein